MTHRMLQADDELEAAGQALVQRARQRADLVLWLQAADQKNISERNVENILQSKESPESSLFFGPEPEDLVVITKADLLTEQQRAQAEHHKHALWSAPGFVGDAAAAVFLRNLESQVLQRLQLPLWLPGLG